MREKFTYKELARATVTAAGKSQMHRSASRLETRQDF